MKSCIFALSSSAVAISGGLSFAHCFMGPARLSTRLNSAYRGAARNAIAD